jgi:hypothetical protein
MLVMAVANCTVPLRNNFETNLAFKYIFFVLYSYDFNTIFTSFFRIFRHYESDVIVITFQL